MPIFTFDNTYARLPDCFFARVAPSPVRAPRMVKLNRPLAELLGADVDRLDSPEGAGVFAGNAVPAGAEPIALAYAGHQFGTFVSQLGDGRAILLGEVVDRDGRRRDLQLKGSGRTPFSRGGDGRAALGPVLREYVVSEAMAAMGIPTTRSLAAVTTGEPVIREEALPGAVLTRVASSHIRVGTFQYFAARRDKDALVVLTSHAIGRHYPDAASEDNPALALIQRVAIAQAELIASWLGVGFVHGVMNTDNCSISGETIDYGPCAFLDEFDPTKTFSSIDHGGRYAFANQPRIAQWNLARLAEALLPLLAEDEEDAVRVATEALGHFGPAFEAAYGRMVRRKLGLATERAEDVSLANDLLERLAAGAVDFAVFFRRLCACASDPAADAEAAAFFADPAVFHDWALEWRKRLAQETASPEERAAQMRNANPAFIPRNHRIEQAIAAAVQGNNAPFERLVRVLSRPFDDQPADAELAEPPAPHERVRATFCGT
jgi:uncharacterized protein YdiU (UPF0061 family)